MSICGVCGTDQETGLRVGLEDDLAPPPPPPPQGPPVHVSIAGGLVITGSLILLILAVIQSTKTESSIQFLSWLCLGAGLGLRHLCVRAVHPRQVGQAAHRRADPGGDRRRDEPDRAAAASTVSRRIRRTSSARSFPRTPTTRASGIRPFEERIDLEAIMFGIG